MALFLTSMFLLSRFFIPNLGFKRDKLPNKLPKEFQIAINKIRLSSKNKKDFAKKIYNYLVKRFHGEPGRVWNDFEFLFVKNINRIWNRKLLHCHQLNYLYRIALVKSKWFKEKEIKIVHTICLLNIHQYLKINIGRIKDKWVKVDLFAKSMNYNFGKKLPVIFNPFKYWTKRKTSFFSFFTVFSYIFKKIF